MKLERINFFQNTKSQYGVLLSFTDGLRSALERQKVRTGLYDFFQLAESSMLAKFAKELPDCTAGFNVLVPKDTAIDPLNLPHLALIVDCATYYPELLDGKHLIASFVEEDSCGFLKMLGFENTLFLPHAIDRELLSSKNVEEVTRARRDLDVVMCGSYYSSEDIVEAWHELLSKKAVEQLIDIAEEVMASNHLSHLQLFSEVVEQHGPLENELMAKKVNLFDILNSLELYIRAVDRLRFMQAIEGVDLHIFGDKKYEQGWKKALQKKSRIFYHDAVSHDALTSVLLRAKVVLNSLPSIKRGFHERLLLGLAHGASVLGNENIYIKKQFAQSKALLNLLPPNYQKANELIATALKDEEARLEAVLATHDTIRKNHTWDARAETLLKVLPPLLERVKTQTHPSPFFPKAH